MHIVESIFVALGGTSTVATELRAPVQTVSSWRSKRAVPDWRRPALLDVARRRQANLSPEAWAYLAGAEADGQTDLVAIGG